METKFPNGYFLRLPKGAKFMEFMNQWAMQHEGQSFAATIIGVAKDFELGFYNLDKCEYQWSKHLDMYEITGLVGNLAWLDGAPVWHVHGTFGDSNSAVIGGHVRDFAVGTTVEVYLASVAPMIRRFDEETGLNLLQTGS
jgi:predicted DNA-binding protein with PD1-like motif